MHLVVPALRIDVGEFFVAAEAVFEESQIPVRVVGVPQPFSHEHETPVDPVAGDGMIGVGDDGAKFRLGFRRQHFIGVEDENPLVPERNILQRPVFFLRPPAVEFELHDLRTVILGDLLRAIRARGIHDHDLVRPMHRGQAGREIRCLVLDRYDDGNWYRHVFKYLRSGRRLHKADVDAQPVLHETILPATGVDRELPDNAAPAKKQPEIDQRNPVNGVAIHAPFHLQHGGIAVNQERGPAGNQRTDSPQQDFQAQR